jgi:DNA-binding winged helix-turn-helix (wHTH) protein
MVQYADELHPYLAALDGHLIQPPLYILAEECCTLGRDQGSTVRIQRDGVSRRHAVISRQDRVFYIADQRSSWGTYVNGERISPFEPYRLIADAIIGLGSPLPLLRFCDPDPTRPPPDLVGKAASVLAHDVERQRFVLHGRPLELQFLTYRLLAYLYAHRDAICRPSDCIYAVWGIDEQSADELNHRLYRLVSELRTALDQHQTAIERAGRISVESQRKRGYSLRLPDEQSQP